LSYRRAIEGLGSNSHRQRSEDDIASDDNDDDDDDDDDDLFSASKKEGRVLQYAEESTMEVVEENDVKVIVEEKKAAPLVVSHAEANKLCYTVIVSDAAMVIPLTRGEPVRRLAEIAAERFAAKHSVKPTLAILSNDGIQLHDEDAADAVLAAGGEVRTQALSWYVPPLDVRYVSACGASEEPHAQLMQALKLADIPDGSGAICLQWWCLGLAQLRPLFTALSHQPTLTVLDLTGNRLTDDGVALLCANALPKMEALRTLTLDNNELTSRSTAHLRAVVDGRAALKALQNLSLAYNFLGDEAMEDVASMTSHLPALKSLSLASCGLVKRFDEETRRAFRKLKVNLKYNEKRVLQQHLED